MTILLYKNGQWLIDGEQPLEGVSLDNLAVILTNPKDGDIVKYDESSGMWVAGEPGSPLPPVTPSDNGKVLGVVDGAWAASEQGKKFIVTLTPTALDYSGTMDKTVAEINAAYEAGMEIWFNVASDGLNVTVPLCSTTVGTGYTYPSFDGFLINSINNVIIAFSTYTTDDGTKQTYETVVYSLTPAS